MTVQDLYPSRMAPEPRLIPRKDPVVYSEWTPDAPLSREDTEEYRRNGLLVLKDCFSEAEVRLLRRESTRLRTAYEELEEETTVLEPDDGAIRSIFKIHKQNDVFERLAGDARFTEIAQFLLGGDIYIHQSRVNYKPGFDGKEFYWHSDFETWHVEDGMPRMRALSMSILLTDNTEFNGPTMFLPGSQEVFVSCVGETPEDHYRRSLRKQEYGVPDCDNITKLAENGIVMPKGKAGTVIIFDCNTLHGSNSNITPFARSNAFLVFNARANALKSPFGATKPRPEFIAARDTAEIIKPVGGRLISDAA